MKGDLVGKPSCPLTCYVAVLVVPALMESSASHENPGGFSVLFRTESSPIRTAQVTHVFS